MNNLANPGDLLWDCIRVINMHSTTGNEKIITNDELERMFDNICR